MHLNCQRAAPTRACETENRLIWTHYGTHLAKQKCSDNRANIWWQLSRKAPNLFHRQWATVSWSTVCLTNGAFNEQCVQWTLFIHHPDQHNEPLIKCKLDEISHSSCDGYWPMVWYRAHLSIARCGSRWWSEKPPEWWQWVTLLKLALGDFLARFPEESSG